MSPRPPASAARWLRPPGPLCRSGRLRRVWDDLLRGRPVMRPVLKNLNAARRGPARDTNDSTATPVARYTTHININAPTPTQPYRIVDTVTHIYSTPDDG